MTIFCDLDGTLLDFFPRYYAILKDFFSSESIPSFEEYRKFRRKGFSEAEFVKRFCHDSKRIDEYFVFRNEMIESQEYLAFDTVINVLALGKLKEKGNLVLLTYRKSEANLIAQVEQLGLRPFFDRIIAASGLFTDAVEFKSHFIARQDGEKIIIGDSKADIFAAKENNITSAGVLTGLSDPERMQFLSPSVIIGSIEDFQSIPELR